MPGGPLSAGRHLRQLDRRPNGCTSRAPEPRPRPRLRSSGTGTVTRTTWTTASIPSYVASVPGVVAGDQKVGVFPAFATPARTSLPSRSRPRPSVSTTSWRQGPGSCSSARTSSSTPRCRANGRAGQRQQRHPARTLTNDQYKIQVDRRSNGIHGPPASSGEGEPAVATWWWTTTPACSPTTGTGCCAPGRRRCTARTSSPSRSRT